MANTDYKSVDDYIASKPEGVQPVLQRVRTIIRRALPGASEVISYQIPAYRLPAGIVVYFAGWKAHYSVYPATARLVTALGEELTPYEISKGTIRFSLAEPVPAKLIASIARLRAREATERAAAQAAGKNGAAKKAAATKRAAKVDPKRTAARVKGPTKR